MDDESTSHWFAPISVQVRGTLTANELALYVALVWRADKTGCCYPSHKTLAKDAGMSVSTAQRTIRSLVDKGVVTKVHRHNPETGGQTSNTYHIPLWDSKV